MRRTEKTVENESCGVTKHNWRPRKVPKGMEKRYLRKNRDHQNHSADEVTKNTENGRRDLRKLAVTQTLVKNHTDGSPNLDQKTRPNNNQQQ